MGIGFKKSVEWKLLCPPQEADARLRRAFAQLEMEVSGPPGAVQGSARRSLRKNRWAAEVEAAVSPLPGGSLVVCCVDAIGSKHYEMLGEIADAIGEDLFDDRGVRAAVDRLGKMGRLFGRKELRHLRNLLHANERVVELGQGTYGDRQGLIILTDYRLFFFEKSLGTETNQEFILKSVTSMSSSKKMTGDTLMIHTAGNEAEIRNMSHGQGDTLTRAFRNLQATSNAPAASPVPPADDLLTQLERLAGMRDRGIISTDEFNAKKAQLMDRL